MYDLAISDTLFRVCDMVIRQVFNRNVARYAIVKPKANSSCLAWTAASIKVVPHLRQLWEVVLETERTLPQASLIISDRVGLIKLFTLGLSVCYTW